MPRTNDLHIDAALTNIAQAYGVNPEFVAPVISPFVQVTKDTGKYFVMGYEEYNLFDDVITDKTEAKEVDWFATTASYATVGRALKTFVSDKAVAVADSAVDPIATTVRKLTKMLNLNREARCAAAFVTATASYTTAIATAWATAATGLPLTDIRTGSETIFARAGVYPNTILIPRTLVPYIVGTAEYRDHIKYVEPANSQLNSEIATRLCGMDVVLTSAQKSSDDLKTTLFTGTRPTTTGVWLADSVYLIYRNPQPSVTDASFMYHLGLTPFRVRRWRDEKRGIGGGTWVQVEYEGVDKVINSLLVQELDNVI
jgi:hypothetical protein